MFTSKPVPNQLEIEKAAKTVEESRRENIQKAIVEEYMVLIMLDMTAEINPANISP
jgi:hypothetical protein